MANGRRKTTAGLEVPFLRSSLPLAPGAVTWWTHRSRHSLSLPNRGDSGAADKLFAALYDALLRMARRELARRGPGVTLGATLLHEAYLDISGRAGAAFPDRNRFMGYAARLMRARIIDYACRPCSQARVGRSRPATHAAAAR